jgi:hypothetical protein
MPAADTASGRCFQTLADEYAQFAEGLRSRWGTTPLPYEEFAGPYRDPHLLPRLAGMAR